MDRLTEGQYVKAEAACSAVNDVMAELEVVAEMFENATSKTEPEHFLARENICRRSLKVSIDGLCDASEELCSLTAGTPEEGSGPDLKGDLDSYFGDPRKDRLWKAAFEIIKKPDSEEYRELEALLKPEPLEEPAPDPAIQERLDDIFTEAQ